MKRGGFAALSIAGSLALAGVAGASYHGEGGGQAPAEGEAAAHVDANGNAFTGGLAFDPVEVSVAVRDVVEWTNTDSSVPHTATEDHGLWRLSGDYGDPSPYQGFGPGETVSRDFDAGTFNYFCEVHPEDMRAVVKVPVTLRSGPRVVVRWGSGPLPEGQVFDVQRRSTRSAGSEPSGRRVRSAGKWRTVLKGIRKGVARFGYRRDVSEIAFRARVRDDTSQNAASGWSPPAILALD